MRILTDAQIACIDLSPAEILDAVEAAIRGLGAGTSSNPPKIAYEPPGSRANVSALAAYDGLSRTVGFKTTYRQDADKNPAPSPFFTTLELFDHRAGAPLALIDCNRIGALRTPAVSALLARCSAPEARVALVIGSGLQGQMAAPFLVEACPNIEKVIIFGHFPNGLARAQEILRHTHPDRSLKIVDDLHAAARISDVVIGAAGPQRTIQVVAADLKIGATSIILGYGLHRDTFVTADYRVATNEEQMRKTGPEYADEDGNFLPVDAELPDILCGRAVGRRSAPEKVFAYNSGMVITDIAIGRLIVDRATQLGIGTEVNLWPNRDFVPSLRRSVA